MTRRVLQVIDDLRRGGAQSVLLALLRLRDPASLDMRVAVVSGPPDESLAAQVRAASTQLTSLDARTLADVRALRSLVGLIRAHEIDLVHTHLVNADVLGGLAARLTGRPVVSTLHSVAQDRWTHSRRRRIAGTVATRYLSSHLIAVSAAVADSHIDILGVPPHKLSVLRNVAVAPLLLPEEFDPERKREQLGLGKRPAICMAARLAPPKDHETLLRALAQVLADRPNATLLLAGDGPNASELRLLARQLGLGSALRFLGVRSDVPEILAAVDVVCNLTHEAEGLSITVLDAMSLGRPVIATYIPSVAEAITDGKNGVLVPPRDVEAAAEALLALTADADLRRRIGDRAQQSSRAYGDPQRWMAETERQYRQALGEPPMGPQCRGG